jgi:hypothetical protein
LRDRQSARVTGLCGDHRAPAVVRHRGDAREPRRGIDVLLELDEPVIRDRLQPADATTFTQRERVVGRVPRRRLADPDDVGEPGERVRRSECPRCRLGAPARRDACLAKRTRVARGDHEIDRVGDAGNLGERRDRRIEQTELTEAVVAPADERAGLAQRARVLVADGECDRVRELGHRRCHRKRGGIAARHSAARERAQLAAEPDLFDLVGDIERHRERRNARSSQTPHAG